jgi:hypothetical protein
MGSTQLGDNYPFLYRNWNKNHESGTVLSAYARILSAVKRVKSASDRLLYTTLRGRWCHIIIPPKRNLMLQKTASMRNWSVYSINSPSSHWNVFISDILNILFFTDSVNSYLLDINLLTSPFPFMSRLHQAMFCWSPLTWRMTGNQITWK